MIEIYLLEQLKAFADHGTLSAAAEHLHLAQPSLSRSMKKLEETLNVTLFNREKNKITLNESGKIAAEYAERILSIEKEMEHTLQVIEKNRHILSIGSCAPGPLMKIHSSASALYNNLTVSSSVEEEDILRNKLDTGEYQLIILDHQLNDETYDQKEFCKERLYLSLNTFHPAASYDSITFKEMDGQNFIMYANVGIWENIVKKMMPNSKYFKQENFEALSELSRFSNLPAFSSSITMHMAENITRNRINIPFSDDEAEICFYIICKKEQKRKWIRLFSL